MVIAGPGIKAGSEFELIASNVVRFNLTPILALFVRSFRPRLTSTCLWSTVAQDTMPTAFGLAGIPTPPSMDGRSYAHLLLSSSAGGIDPAAPAPARALLAAQPTATEWRTEQLIQYGAVARSCATNTWRTSTTTPSDACALSKKPQWLASQTSSCVSLSGGRIGTTPQAALTRSGSSSTWTPTRTS